MFSGIISLDDALSKQMLPPLETFPTPSDTQEHSGIIRITFPEFTCLCPKTGYPDFAAIHLYYVPEDLCIELKSWKLFLNSFRMIGTFHESVTAYLYTTVLSNLKPKWALLIGDFFPRGNVNTTILFETPTARPKGADILIGQVVPHCRGV